MKKGWIVLSLCLATSLCLAALLAWSLGGAREVEPSLQAAASEPPPTPPKPTTPPPEPTAPPPKPTTVRLVAAGDNLIHDNIYQQAAARTGYQGYDFSVVYEDLAPLVKGAEVALYNQETPLAEAVAPLSGYPRFNSPRAVGDEMMALGFNVVNLANNHMFDMREVGVLASLDYWDAQPEVLSLGLWRDQTHMERPVLLEAEGIVFGFVAVTEQTNGLSLPRDTSLRYLRSDEEELIEQQISLARAQSDFVVVSIHWGEENVSQPSAAQRALAQRFVDWGADLVVGHHSHTLQPAEWLTGAGGNRALVAYSLGNLVSSMAASRNMLGGLLTLDITKDPAAQTTAITSAALEPVVTHYEGAGRREVRVYQLSNYTDELARRHGMRLTDPHFGRAYLLGLIEKNLPQGLVLPVNVP